MIMQFDGEIGVDVVGRYKEVQDCKHLFSTICFDADLYLLELSQQGKNVIADRVNDSIGILQEKLKAARQTMASEVTRNNIDIALEATEVFAREFDSYVKLVSSQLHERDSVLRPAALASVDISLKVRDRIYEFIDEINSDANSNVALTNKVIIIFSLISIVIGSIIAGYISHGISSSLRRIIANLSNGSEQVSSAATQVLSASQSLAEGSTEQAAGLEETTSSLNEIAVQVRNSVEKTTQAEDLTNKADKATNKGTMAMKDMAQAITDIHQSAAENW